MTGVLRTTEAHRMTEVHLTTGVHRIAEDHHTAEVRRTITAAAVRHPAAATAEARDHSHQEVHLAEATAEAEVHPADTEDNRTT